MELALDSLAAAVGNELSGVSEIKIKVKSPNSPIVLRVVSFMTLLSKFMTPNPAEGKFVIDKSNPQITGLKTYDPVMVSSRSPVAVKVATCNMYCPEG